MLPLAGKQRIPFHAGWDCVIYIFFFTLLAGKKPSNMNVGWDFYFLKVLLASSEERVFFFPGKLNINIGCRKSTLLAFKTLYNQFCEKSSLGTLDILRYDSRESMEEALAVHDRNLENLLKRARSVILKFNKNKLRLNLD